MQKEHPIALAMRTVSAGQIRRSVRVSKGRSTEIIYWFEGIAYAVLMLSWLGLRIQPVLAHEPVHTLDTLGYELVAGYPAWSLKFFVGIRPFVVPLMLKLTHTDAGYVAGQTLVSLLCWGALALVVASLLRQRSVRFVACAAVLGFSASEPITRWDFLIMSESLSLSLMALFIACWLTLLTRWHWWKVALLLVVALFWGCTRDTNAYALAMCGVALIPAVLLRRLRQQYLAIAAALLVLFVAINITAELSFRWVFPFLNVVTTRILPEAELTTAMEQEGMPVSPDLLSFTGKWAYGQDYGLYTDPALEDFRSWLYTRGKSQYIHFLVTHPRWALAAPFLDRDRLFGLTWEDDGFPRSSSRAQEWIGTVTFVRSPMLFVSLLVAALLIGASALSRGNIAVPAIWAVPVCLLLFAWPYSMIVWHGDSMDVGRHAIQAGIQARLGMLLLLLFSADLFAQRRSFALKA